MYIYAYTECSITFLKYFIFPEKCVCSLARMKRIYIKAAEFKNLKPGKNNSCIGWKKKKINENSQPKNHSGSRGVARLVETRFLGFPGYKNVRKYGVCLVRSNRSNILSKNAIF